MYRRRIGFRWLAVVLLVLSLFACSSKREVFFRTVYNTSTRPGIKWMYSYDSYRWYVVDSVLKVPVVGDGSINDPSLYTDENGLYHAVWVTSKNGKRGMVHTTSEDFKVWSTPAFVHLVTSDSTEMPVATPRLLFDGQTDTCLVYWSSVRKGMERVYAMKTVDFKQFTPARRLYDPGFAIQHPCLVCRGPNDYVLIIHDNDPLESNLKVAFSSRKEGPYERLSPSFSAFQTRRPSVVKIGAKWHIFHEDFGKKETKVLTTLDFDSFEDITEETEVPFQAGGGDICLIPRKPFKKMLRYLHCKPVKERK